MVRMAVAPVTGVTATPSLILTGLSIHGRVAGFASITGIHTDIPIPGVTVTRSLTFTDISTHDPVFAATTGTAATGRFHRNRVDCRGL